MKRTLSLILLTLLTLSPVGVMADVVNLTYVPATTWTNGDPLVIRSTRLLCNGQVVAAHRGATGTFAPDLTPGTYVCHAVHTAVDPNPNNDLIQCSIIDSDDVAVCISGPSNTKTTIVGTVVIITVGNPTDLEVVP